MRQLVGMRLELGVAQRALLEHHRHAHPACARACAANSSGSVAGSHRLRGRVPRSRMLCALRRRQHLQRPDRSDPAPQPPPPAAAPDAQPALHAAPIEQVAGVFQHADEPRRTASAAAPLRHAHRQVELRARARHRLRPALSPASSAPHAALLCNASITWNSGCRDSERAGLSTSTSRSNGTSWCARPQGCPTAPGPQAPESSDCPTCRCEAPGC